MRRVAFLDRDGTLNVDVDFLAHPSQLQVIPGARRAVEALDAAGYTIVVVTNQSGIARGYYDERILAAIHAALHDRLGRIPLAYLHCPHHPEGGHGYGGACACRKPASGLIRQACELFGLSLDGGVLIGDAARDLLMEPTAPLRRIHVQSGKPAAEQLAALRAAGVEPDHSAVDLEAAVRWLLARDRGA
ncbi:MAG: hypothetical protein RL398_2326 [Planctomycetota bacterium]